MKVFFMLLSLSAFADNTSYIQAVEDRLGVQQLDSAALTSEPGIEGRIEGTNAPCFLRKVDLGTTTGQPGLRLTLSERGLWAPLYPWTFSLHGSNDILSNESYTIVKAFRETATRLSMTVENHSEDAFHPPFDESNATNTLRFDHLQSSLTRVTIKEGRSSMKCLFPQ